MTPRRLPVSPAPGWSPGHPDTSRGVYFRCRLCGSLAVLAAGAGPEPTIRCTTCGFDDRATNRRDDRKARGRWGEITILAGGP